MSRFVFRILSCLLICGVSLITGSCSSNSAVDNQPVQIDSRVAAQSPTPQADPTPQPTERIEYVDLTLVRFPDEPMLLTQVEIVNANDPKSAVLKLETQNVSKKGVKLVTYGMGMSYLCTEYMSAPVPSPRIGYGDWNLEGVVIKSSNNEPLLKPGEKAPIKVSGDEFLLMLLNRKTYKSCPEGYKKPELMLQGVYFDDGTMWRPNQYLRLR